MPNATAYMYFDEMEQEVNWNTDIFVIDNYLKQFPEQERELEYCKYVISNYIKFIFIEEARSQGKDYTEEILLDTQIDIDLPECVTEIYSDNCYKDLIEEAAWLSAHPEDIFSHEWGSPELSFYDMESCVSSYTDDSVIEGALEGSEDLIKTYISMVIDEFIKEMIITDCRRIMTQEYWDNHFGDIVCTFTYIRLPPCICDLYPLEWVNNEFGVC